MKDATMTKNLQLYSIALVPPKNIREEVLDFQRLAEKKFNSKVTLRSPVHITLVPPFNANAEELKQIIKKVLVIKRKRYEDELSYIKINII